MSAKVLYFIPVENYLNDAGMNQLIESKVKRVKDEYILHPFSRLPSGASIVKPDKATNILSSFSQVKEDNNID